MHRCNCRDLGRRVGGEFDPEFLLVMLKRGDVSALDRLVERYRNYVALLVRLQTGGPDRGAADFEENIRQVWLEIQRKSTLFRGTSEREFLGWIGKIVKAVLAYDVRQNLGTTPRNPRLEHSPDELEESSFALNVSLVAPGVSAGQRAVECDRAVLLADALHALPDEYREVIILRQLEGLSFPHVARRLGRTEESVKSAWLRALAQFRTTLEGLR